MNIYGYASETTSKLTDTMHIDGFWVAGDIQYITKFLYQPVPSTNYHTFLVAQMVDFVARKEMMQQKEHEILKIPEIQEMRTILFKVFNKLYDKYDKQALFNRLFRPVLIPLEMTLVESKLTTKIYSTSSNSGYNNINIE